MRKAIISLVAALTLLSISGVGAAALAPIENPDFANADVGVVETDQTGNRVWRGEQPEVMYKILADFTPLRERHSDNIIDSSLTSDRQVLEVYVRDVAGPGVAQLSALASKYPQHIRVKTTTVTEADAQRVSDYVTENNLWGNPVLGVGLSAETNSVTVDVEPSYLAERAPMPVDGAELGVKLTFNAGEKIQPDIGRQNDYPMYFAGGAITKSGTRCSTGVPISVAGKFHTLTAGHCGKGTWNNGTGQKFVGSTFTTTWSATAHAYGDWQLLTGSHYALKVFSGAVSGDASYLNITGGNFSTLPIGAALCTSGSTTGQKCRFYVVATNKKMLVNDVQIGHLTLVKSDQNLDGKADCGNGTKPGDSGGMVYYSDGRGGVTAYGVVTGEMQYQCLWAFTQLSGVRAWNSSTQVG